MYYPEMRQETRDLRHILDVDRVEVAVDDTTIMNAPLNTLQRRASKELDALREQARKRQKHFNDLLKEQATLCDGEKCQIT